MVFKDKNFHIGYFWCSKYGLKNTGNAWFFVYKYLPNYDFLIPILQNYDKYICIILCQIQFYFTISEVMKNTKKKKGTMHVFLPKTFAIIEPINEIINYFLESQFFLPNLIKKFLIRVFSILLLLIGFFHIKL